MELHRLIIVVLWTMVIYFRHRLTGRGGHTFINLTKPTSSHTKEKTTGCIFGFRWWNTSISIFHFIQDKPGNLHLVNRSSQTLIKVETDGLVQTLSYFHRIKVPSSCREYRGSSNCQNILDQTKVLICAVHNILLLNALQEVRIWL